MNAWPALRRPAQFLAVVLSLFTAACAGGPPAREAVEALDESTGTTVARLEHPLVLYREDPALAVNARDYLYVAPLYVEGSGQHSWWLWVGAWSTIDRGVNVEDIGASEMTGAELLVDGEPMDLDAAGRRAGVPGVAAVPYAAPVRGVRGVYLPLTASQVARLGRAAGIGIRTGHSQGSPRQWRSWSPVGDGLRDFADLTLAHASGADR